MSTFGSRPTRFNLAVPLSFETDGEIVNGQSINVSESGLLASFQSYVELWSTGSLSLVVGEYHLSIKVRVARAQGPDTGLAFLITTPNDELTVGLMVAFASAGMKPGDKVRADC